ncbi:cytoplasm protein [Histoplasma capsulatum H143]|uniref:Cytoplasm protein n=1 Tax=Ajellomyces capsulatus (strain H143) TaxID=544712 RepID=C6HH05_AJECH|nr:cytoplasm protein [Histoplasma capsulatum H143]
MGWISLGTFVISVSFLLFKHPLATWSLAPLYNLLRIRPATPDIPSSQAPQPIRSEASGLDEEASKDGEHRSDSQLEDSTPKATPEQLPLVDVPTFNLECPAVVDERLDISLNSSNTISLSQNRSPSSTTPTSRTGTMLPPPRPSLNTPLRPPLSAASTLRGPLLRGLTSSTLAPIQVQGKPQPSRQVALEPGRSPLDWAALTSQPNHKLRGENLPPTLIRVTPSMLKAHNGRKGRDAWTSYMGKVYNITPYLPFHPGGKGEILRGAGKDSEKHFKEIHPWVNWDGMLAECMVGILVSEGYEVGGGGGSLEAMD